MGIDFSGLFWFGLVVGIALGVGVSCGGAAAVGLLREHVEVH